MIGVLGVLASLFPISAQAEPTSLVYLNGQPTPVYFNDGDSFRVLDGELVQTTARLAGFNTLETHGPVHQWGGWHRKELYALAKAATLNARRGTWHCTSDLKRDGYGRILWFCLDLAKDQVRHGYAHALVVGDEVAHPEILEAQREAIGARRGMWAKGVPTFVISSTHSSSEATGGLVGQNYNRLVSTVDGHSERMLHNDRYDECQNVCSKVTITTRENALHVIAELRANTESFAAVKGVSDALLIQIIDEYAHLKKMPRVLGEGSRAAIERALRSLLDQGAFGPLEKQTSSCMVYVSFERRYRADKPECLKW